MPIEAVKIPQNVYVEDRIIGPVTLRQLMITGIGAGISYALYATATKAGGATVPIAIACWTPAVIFAMFAFLKINDLSLFNIILLMVEGFNKPSQRYWSPHPGISINLITRKSTQEFATIETKALQNAAKLAELTRQLEKRRQEFADITNHEAQSLDTVSSAAPAPAVVAPAKAPEAVAVAAAEPEAAPLPVRTDRVQASGLEPERSIDGIAPASRFGHLLADSH